MLIVIAVVILVGGVLLLRAGMKILGALVSLVGFVLVAGVLLLAVLGKAYRVPSESMTPTIGVGDRVLAIKGADPGLGDIAVFNPPQAATADLECGVESPAGQLCPRPGRERSDVTFIQRVVARAGDTVAIRGGRVIRNGKRADEPYARACKGEACEFPEPITIPRGHVFLLGDNRGASADSRFWGPLPEKWLKGRVVARYWPPKDAGKL